MSNQRPRVCAAIIRQGSILMVRHREAGREYWTLPGGGIEAGESPEEAIIREVNEETGLQTTVSRYLFERKYLNGTSQCFLMDMEGEQEAQLGYDPEEEHLKEAQRMLQGIAWHTLESMKDDIQVADVLRHLA